MITRIQVTATVKPGRMADALEQVHEVNAITQRLSGISGQLFNVAFGQQCFGGVVMSWDWPSSEARASFEEQSAADGEWLALVAQIIDAEGPWVLPAPRDLLRQIA